MPIDRLKFHYADSRSDKVYELWMRDRAPIGGIGWDVMYAHGRRSSGATSGHKPKNDHALSSGAAEMFLNDMIQERLRKGYHYFGGCSVCNPNGVQPTSYHNGLSSGPRVDAKLLELAKEPKPKPVAPTAPARTIAFDDDDL